MADEITSRNKEVWLSPPDVNRLGILPFGLKAIRKRMKDGRIKGKVEQGRYYTTKENVQKYLDEIPEV